MTLPESGPMIEVQGVAKSFGATRALDGVDLEVPAASVLGLLGPNGAGKTTLVKVLATLIKPDSGTARVAGLDVVEQATAVRSVIGLAGQYAAVDEMLTGRENLEMVGRLYRLSARVARQRAEEALERLALTDAADRPVRTYSGGMRRRLDLGASLVGQPRILILDEPTTGLDPRTRIELWDFMKQLVRDGTTVLLTTQYLEEADALASSIVVIDHGRVIARGTADELKSQLGGDVLEVGVEHVADMDRVMTALAPLGAEPSQVDGDGRHLTIPTGAGAGALVEAVRALDDAQIPIADLALRRPSLDDVFLALTGHKTTADGDGIEGNGAGRPPGPRPSRVRNGARHDRDQRPRLRPSPAAVVALPRSAALVDGLTVARRNLLRILRTPQLVFFSTIQPIMFVLLFNYVFGGAIDPTGGGSYIDYLLPGIMVQTVAFGATSTAIGLATDMGTGIMDRFRSLPMARSAVLSGRTSADAVRNLFVVLLIVTVGTLDRLPVPQRVPSRGRRHPPRRAVRVRVLVDLRLHRPEDRSAGDGPAGRLRPHLPARVRQLGFRPHGGDARLVADLRQPPAGDADGQRHPRPQPGRRGRGSVDALPAVDRRHHRGVRATRRGSLPQGLRPSGRQRSPTRARGLPLRYLPRRGHA